MFLTISLFVLVFLTFLILGVAAAFGVAALVDR